MRERDKVDACGHQVPGDGTEGVAHLPGDTADALRRLGADEGAVAQSPQDGGVGDTCGFGDILDGYSHIVESTSIPGRIR
jgi:hypothetical protein